MSTKELYEEVTSSIIEKIRAGVDSCEWVRPWATGSMMPHNVASNKHYRGVNVLLLWDAAARKGYEGPSVWGTYKQWAEKGGQVQKGEKATTILFWKPFEKENKLTGKVDRFAMARTFRVFHVSQQEGYTLPIVEDAPTALRVERAEAFFGAVGADWSDKDPTRAYYSSVADKINVPNISQFVDAERYYATVAHEHGHWTGHESRLDRDLANRFGSAAYAGEELVAEMSAAFTCATLGLRTFEREDHAQYLQSWLQVIASDPSALVHAASQAAKATDWLVYMAAKGSSVEVETAA